MAPVYDLPLNLRRFDHGLSLLSLQVMHDCRWVSDLLLHRFGVQLNCVYDTQVADVLIHRHEKGGEIPRYTRALADCLLEYLEISISEVYSKMVHSKTQLVSFCRFLDDSYNWQYQPLKRGVKSKYVYAGKAKLD